MSKRFSHAGRPRPTRVLLLPLPQVEEGGETEFKKLGIKGRPKKGRALLWPSTFDARPLEQDIRTSPFPHP